MSEFWLGMLTFLALDTSIRFLGSMVTGDGWWAFVWGCFLVVMYALLRPHIPRVAELWRRYGIRMGEEDY